MKRDPQETDMSGFAPSVIASVDAPIAVSALRRRLARARAWFAACRETARQRRTLALLDDDRLRDIGLSRVDVEREVGRNPWDL
jgi:uncharacterized protein YjiS (DUF1127 family)